MADPQSASFLALVSLCTGGPDGVKRRITLHFPREAVHQPITYRLAVEFDIAAKILRAHGARSIRAAVSHCILNDVAVERLRGGAIDELITTNSTPIDTKGLPVTVLSNDDDLLDFTFERVRALRPDFVFNHLSAHSSNMAFDEPVPWVAAVVGDAAP